MEGALGSESLRGELLDDWESFVSDCHSIEKWLMLISCPYITVNYCVLVSIKRSSMSSLLVIHICHPSFPSRAHSPCFGFCTHFDWLWQNAAEVLTQDARHSWHFTFCFLEPSHTTVRNLCHTERNQGLLIDSSNLWASWFSSMWRSWISQDQPRPQTTAVLVVIIGRRRTHQSSSRNMRKYTVVVTYTKDRLSPFSALSTALSRTLA